MNLQAVIIHRAPFEQDGTLHPPGAVIKLPYQIAIQLVNCGRAEFSAVEIEQEQPEQNNQPILHPEKKPAMRERRQRRHVSRELLTT